MNRDELVSFLTEARRHTYAADAGKVRPAFPNSYQLEYTQNDWLYRDIYFMGSALFTGIETVYYRNELTWSMSYYGNFKSMTEEEIDTVLRKALIQQVAITRLWKPVTMKIGEYEYICNPDPASTSIDEIRGSEAVRKNGKQMYFFTYTGGYMGK